MSTDRSTPLINRQMANRQIIEEAATWFVEINEGDPDHATRERFDEWLRRSPEHARAYLRILPVWEEGAALDTQANGDPKALIAWAREGNNVVPLGPGDRHSRERPALGSNGGENAEAGCRSQRRPFPDDGPKDISQDAMSNSVKRATRRRRLPFAVAASIALLCLAIGAGYLVQHWNLYETGVGEQRLIALSDGSRVELNSRSRLRVSFDENERGLELLDGQALFRVVKDAKRPFIVRSGDVVVQAIGTQFDVYRKKTGTIVTVVEGRVAVAPIGADLGVGHSMSVSDTQARPEANSSAVVLSAGQQTVSARKRIPKATAVNVIAATAWTQQRLEFSATPLAEVAEEFNRYNERQLVVRGESLQDFHITGTFSSSDPASLLAFLKAQPGVTVEEDARKDIIIAAE